MDSSKDTDRRQSLHRLRETLWLNYIQECKGHTNSLCFSDWIDLHCRDITDEIIKLDEKLSRIL